MGSTTRPPRRPTLHPADFNELLAIYPPRQIALAARDGILEFDYLDNPYADSVQRFVNEQREREAELWTP